MPFNEKSQFIQLKDDEWLKNQKVAGCVLAAFMKDAIHDIQNKKPNISLSSLNESADKYIRSFDCTPTFLNYKGFPGAICTSVNEQLVHGIPSDYVLQDGDVVTLDFGVTYKGAIADAAFTAVYGEPKSKEIARMLQTCQNALRKAIRAIKPNKNLGVIGSTIHKETKNSGFGLVTKYGGHGIDLNKPHAPPFVANKAQENEGIRIQSGLTIAIEPMLTLGSPHTRTLDDGWTVVTPNIGCHFEHTVFIKDNETHIITAHGLEE